MNGAPQKSRFGCGIVVGIFVLVALLALAGFVLLLIPWQGW